MDGNLTTEYMTGFSDTDLKRAMESGDVDWVQCFLRSAYHQGVIDASHRFAESFAKAQASHQYLSY